MELEERVLERVRAYTSLSRWEKSELGRDLRRRGLSYGEIMELIPVKKSTLATWCRDVRLTEEQIEAIKERRPPKPGSRVAGLSRNTHFNKSFIKPDGTGHRKNHLPYGVCLVSKRRCADAFHATMAWIQFLQKRLGQ